MNAPVFRLYVDSGWNGSDLVLVSRGDYARDKYRWKSDIPGPTFGLRTLTMPGPRGNTILFEHKHFEIVPDSLFNELRGLSKATAAEVYRNKLKAASVIKKDYTYLPTPEGQKVKAPKKVRFPKQRAPVTKKKLKPKVKQPKEVKKSSKSKKVRK